MAQIKVVGNAAVVSSALSLEQLKTVKKYRPEALVLKGGEDGKEKVFCIDVADSGNGSLNKYGATFAGESHDAAKLATITMMVEPVGDIKAHIVDKFGGAILKLNELESKLVAVLGSIAADKALAETSVVVE